MGVQGTHCTWRMQGLHHQIPRAARQLHSEVCPANNVFFLQPTLADGL